MKGGGGDKRGLDASCHLRATTTGFVDIFSKSKLGLLKTNFFLILKMQFGSITPPHVNLLVALYALLPFRWVLNQVWVR